MSADCLMMQCSGIKVSGYRVSNPISARRSLSLPFGGFGGGSGLAVSAAVFVTEAWNLSVSGSVSCSSLQRKDRQHIASASQSPCPCIPLKPTRRLQSPGIPTFQPSY